MTTMKKIDHKHYGLALAFVASLRSEDPYKKVGACALSHDNRVLSTGYNGLRSGYDLSDEQWADRDLRRKFILHAEANCLSMTLRGDVKTLCVTLSPCLHCAQLIVAHKINEVVYSEEYSRDLDGLNLLDEYQVKLVKIDRESISRIFADSVESFTSSIAYESNKYSC